jgi:hypothetical protein
MIKIVIVTLSLALLTLPQANSTAHAAGIAQHTDISAAKRRAKKPKFSRAHCAKLNQEKARLYGICGY